jgi:hypothetical protein
MPLAGYSWITQDPHAFSSWIALLNNEKDASNSLKPHLDRARKELIDKPLPNPTAVIKPIKPIASALAEDFLDWLKDGIETKKIRINDYDADIHIIKGGLFLEMPAIIKRFCAQSSKKPKIEQVMAQLKKTGFISSSEDREELATYLYTNTKESSPLSFMWKPAPKTQSTTSAKKSNSKTETRQGIEVFMPCFLTLLRIYFIDLSIEENFISIEFKKEKIKKKIAILRKKKLYHARLEKLRKEIEESIHLQKKTQSN